MLGVLARRGGYLDAFDVAVGGHADGPAEVRGGLAGRGLVAEMLDCLCHLAGSARGVEAPRRGVGLGLGRRSVGYGHLVGGRTERLDVASVGYQTVVFGRALVEDGVLRLDFVFARGANGQIDQLGGPLWGYQALSPG